jgi:hypothetical protein
MLHTIVLFLVTFMGLIMALPVSENTALLTLESDHPVVRFSCSSIAQQPLLTPNSAGGC